MIEESFEFAGSDGVLELSYGFGFDLPDAFSRDLEDSRCGTHRIALRCPGIGAIPVVAPFLDDTVHVIQAEGIGRCPTHGQGYRRGMPVILLMPVILPRQPIARMIGGGCAGATGVFPLRFGRQTVGLALSLRQPPRGEAVTPSRPAAIPGQWHQPPLPEWVEPSLKVPMRRVAKRAILALLAAAEIDRATLLGRVTMNLFLGFIRWPLRNAEVKLQEVVDKSFVTKGETQTDIWGRYSFESLDEGAYRITAEAEGFISDFADIEIEGGRRIRQNISLKLQRDNQSAVLSSQSALAPVDPADQLAHDRYLEQSSDNDQSASSASTASLAQIFFSAPEAVPSVIPGPSELPYLYNDHNSVSSRYIRNRWRRAFHSAFGNCNGIWSCCSDVLNSCTGAVRLPDSRRHGMPGREKKSKKTILRVGVRAQNKEL